MRAWSSSLREALLRWLEDGAEDAAGMDALSSINGTITREKMERRSEQSA